MKIAVFGGAGRTGRHVVEQALAAGYHVVALVRTPSKLDIQNERLTVVQGDVQNPTQVEQVVAGADAVISLLGPTSKEPPLQVSRGTQNILAALRKHGVRRLIVSAGAGVGDPSDAPKLIHKAINVLLKLTAREHYEDIMQTVELVRASDRDWTIVRVPRLMDGPKTGKITVAYVGKGMGMTIARADMADFMLKLLQSDAYMRQAPAISN